MKALRSFLSPLILVLMFGVAAGTPLLPKTWGGWVLPGFAGLSLLMVARDLPFRLWVAGGALLALIGIYAMNPAYEWSEGVGLLPLDSHISGLPGSAFADGSWVAFGLALALFAAFALASRLSEGQVRAVQMAALLGGAAMALMVLGQRLEPRPFPVFERTGIFVNENHFAVFSNLILPVVLALAARAHFRAVREGHPSSPAGLYLLAAVLMGAAVVMCRSRAGVAVMALVVAAHVGLVAGLRRQYPFLGGTAARWMKRAGVMALALAMILAALGFAREWKHLGDIRGEWEFRFGIVKDTVGMWRDHWVWGTGPGTFTEVFPYYQSESFEGRSIRHAHCEPVQFLSEFGVAGGIGVLMALGLLLSATRKVPSSARDFPAFAELERRSFALGLCACALHSIVDFPLRVPLIALLAAAWAGAWAGHRGGIPERESGARVGAG